MNHPESYDPALASAEDVGDVPANAERISALSVPQGRPVMVGDLLGWDICEQELRDSDEDLEFVEDRRHELRLLNRGRGIIPCTGEPEADEFS